MTIAGPVTQVIGNNRNVSRVVTLTLLLALISTSGACALIYQLAWMRELRLIFGGTTVANSAVLAIFMGGLGLGNFCFGRLADRVGNPLRLYATLELTIAVCGVASPFLIDLVEIIYHSSGGQPALGPAGATLVRVALSALVLAVPTIAMGGTLPAVARYVTTPSDSRRGALALAYGVNTVGALAGPLLCVFVLLEHLGTRNTIWAAAALNLVVALAAGWLSRSAAHEEPQVPKSPSDELAPQAAVGLPPSAIYLAAGVVGLVFFSMELVWFRMLTPLIAGTVYTFGLILSTALAGIGVGAVLYPILFARFRPGITAFAIICLVEATLMALPYAAGDHLALLALGSRAAAGTSFIAMIGAWLTVTSLVVFPAALASGIQFPLLIALLGSGTHSVGDHVGRAFAFNTAGAILGAIVSGFFALPFLSAPGLWIANVLLMASLGTAALIVAWVRERSLWGTTTCVAVLVLIGWSSVQSGPGAYWRHGGIGAGRGDVPATDLQAASRSANESLIWEADGHDAGVGIKTSNLGLALFVNGKSDGASIGDAPTQILLGLMGALVHPQPESALVVGLGTGETAGWLASVDSLSRVDVVEIEPVVVEMARRCEAANRQILQNEKLNLIFNDAREQLQITNQRYDIIVSEPSNPYRAGVANLFTTEFYHAVANRLTDEGVFVQWLQAYEVDATSIAMVLETLRANFSLVEIWMGCTNDMILVCSNVPNRTGHAVLSNRLSIPAAQEGLRLACEGTRLEELAKHFIAGVKTVDEFRKVHGGKIVSDDRNLLEYAMARTVGQATPGQHIPTVHRLAESLGDAHPQLPGTIRWDLVREYWSLRERSSVQSTDSPDMRIRIAALSAFPDRPEEVVRLWEAQPREPILVTEVAIVGQSYAALGNRKALPLIDRLQPDDPTSAKLLLAEYYFVTGDQSKALELVLAALEDLHQRPWVRKSAITDGLVIAAELARRDAYARNALRQQLERPFATYFLETGRLAALAELTPGTQPKN